MNADCKRKNLRKSELSASKIYCRHEPLMITMKAAVHTGREQIEIQHLPLPDVTTGTILLKILACGVCGSDVRIFQHGNSRVRYPAVGGHEIAAEVVAVGEGVTAYQAGDLVSLGADIPCGQCRWCQNGLGNCCEQNYALGYQFPGGFAEYCLLNPQVVKYGPICRVPAGTPLESAALAEPLACCINGLERINFAPGQSVAIIGAGPIGILLAQTARAFGSPHIILCDRDAQRLELARVAGADHYLDTASHDIRASVRDLTNGLGVDAVFTACPSVEAQEEALDIVATRGAINFFGGLPSTARPVQLLSNTIHYKEIIVTGSHGSTPRHHALAVELIASGRVDLSQLVTHRYPLDDIHQAFATARDRLGLKVMVKPHG